MERERERDRAKDLERERGRDSFLGSRKYNGRRPSIDYDSDYDGTKSDSDLYTHNDDAEYDSYDEMEQRIRTKKDLSYKQENEELWKHIEFLEVF